ncbi:MAG: hypothetical protein AVDCRST_MAG11-4001 [uncultured Gemmatimonadaceae bacterium]|uniref:Uncharacterized protein n=1 Tax=uncultured Gemmatimonadaceae bacterium TaxID=246130 RepID=A0A6J4MG08_9BACT|nr:MAG: hypothetical protein AVDCRST_MAG11-4001 [uncultured Gemmatimonadaceae bacterium]
MPHATRRPRRAAPAPPAAARLRGIADPAPPARLAPGAAVVSSAPGRRVATIPTTA